MRAEPYLFNILPLASLHELATRPDLMEEKRKHPRTEISEPAYVS